MKRLDATSRRITPTNKNILRHLSSESPIDHILENWQLITASTNEQVSPKELGLNIYMGRFPFYILLALRKALRYGAGLFQRCRIAEGTHEFHGRRSGSGSSSLVVAAGGASVGSAVTFGSPLASLSSSSFAAAGPGLSSGLSLQGGGHDLGREVEVVAEVLDALVREVPVDGEMMWLGAQLRFKC